MLRRSWKGLLASGALIAGVGCTPTINFVGQYIAALGDKDIGIGTNGQFGVFPPGDSQPTQRDSYEPITLPNNQFTGLMRHPGGDIPATFLATLVDTNADQFADRIDMTLNYPDTHTLDISMLAGDAYEDYRCWLDHAGLGTHCYTALSIPACTVTPLGGRDFHVEATIGFRDDDGGLNPGGSVQFFLKQDPYAGSNGGTTSIPGSSPAVPSFPNGLTLAATGVEDGVLTISTDVTVDPASTTAEVVFYPVLTADQDTAIEAGRHWSACQLPLS